MMRAAALCLVALLSGCGDDDTGGDANAVCVWNQAYQENYQEDSVADILANARNCYVLVDPFQSTEARDAIPEMKQAGNTVGCYVSAGTCEDWRDDFAEMQPYCVETAWGEWEGEYFVDMPEPGLLAVMQARVERMAGWGCDMVELDNMDWAFDDANRTDDGVTASAEDGIAYFQAVCDAIHESGMGCMAKNTREGAEGFDGVTFESYTDQRDWWDASELHGFLAEGKLGIVVHYDEPDCPGVLADYRAKYGADLSFICEDRATERYLHF